jgi:hypothetical protein
MNFQQTPGEYYFPTLPSVHAKLSSMHTQKLTPSTWRKSSCIIFGLHQETLYNWFFFSDNSKHCERCNNFREQHTAQHTDFMFPSHKLYDECDAVSVVGNRHGTYLRDKEDNSKNLCCKGELMVFNSSCDGDKSPKIPHYVRKATMLIH